MPSSPSCLFRPSFPPSGSSPTVTYVTQASEITSTPIKVAFHPSSLDQTISHNPNQVVQTEPVDFSSSQPPPNLTQPNFSPPVPLPLQPRPFEPPVSMSVSSFVRGPSPASQPDSLTRYRAAAQAPTYASLSLPSPYETICSSYGGPGYPSYQQASYSCLPYPPTTFSGMPSYQASICRLNHERKLM